MTRLFAALLLGAFLLPAASAQPVTFDPATLDALFSKSPKVEVNLNGSLLRMAAMGSEDDPETAEMLSALRSITVRVYNLEDALSGLDERLSAFGDRLEGAGWQTLVRVRPTEEDSDDVWIYVRDAGDRFDGMAVMALDNEDGEASFVFIDGPIDPAQVGRLGGRFGGVHMDDHDAHEAEVEARAAMEEARAEMEEARADIETAQAEADAEIAEMEAELDRMKAERARAEAERNSPN